jgi:hypothetical protein
VTAQAEPRRCRGDTAEGEPCQARPEWVNEDGWCLSHDPSPEAARARKQRARLGGAVTAAKNSKGIDPDSLPPLDGPKAAARWTEVIGLAVTTGRLSSAQAQAGLRAVSEFLRAHEAGTVQDRIEELAARLEGRRR